MGASQAGAGLSGGSGAREAAFLALLSLGVSALIAGAFWTRLHWRGDVPPYGRRTRGLDVLLHPGRYATVDALRAIRALNVLGGLLLAGAVAVLAYEALKTIRG